MTVGEYIEIQELKQKIKEIKACMKTCNNIGNKADEELLKAKYLEPTQERIKILEIR